MQAKLSYSCLYFNSFGKNPQLRPHETSYLSAHSPVNFVLVIVGPCSCSHGAEISISTFSTGFFLILKPLDLGSSLRVDSVGLKPGPDMYS